MTGIISWIKRQFELLRYKRTLIADNNRLKCLLNFKIDKILTKLEALDQDKVYFICIPEEEDAKYFSQMYSMVRANMKWTPPYILIVNKALNSEEDLQSLLRQARAKKIKG